MLFLQFGVLVMLQLKPQSTREHLILLLYGNCYLHIYSLIHPVDEFSLKEMRTWVSARFHLVIFVYGVNQENKGTGRVLDSGHEIWKTSPQTLFRITFRILSNINDRAYLQKYMECLEIIKLMVVVFMLFFTCGGLILFLWGVVLILRKVFT